MNDFRAFGSAVAKHFSAMSAGELFRADIPGDELWTAYLAAFPEGTNPIYRTRAEHDGSYDRAFVRKMGNVVSISADGSVTTIWQAASLAYPYCDVAAALHDLVSAQPVVSLFRIKEQKVGYERTIERLADGGTKEWNHFHAAIDPKHYTTDVGTVVGEANTTIEVMHRGFLEIQPEAVDAVLDLIEQGTLYRGSEFEATLKEFQRAQRRYLRAQPAEANALAWLHLRTPISRIRNTVIGTLLTDLSEGQDIERAVKSYETKVAPTNYKRPTALITKAMVEDATKTIAELGLESALERRFARISDVSVNNVLWVDGQVKSKMKDGIAGLLMQEVKVVPAELKKVAISIDAFMASVLPEALGVELFFGNGLQNNLMSLTAPVSADVRPIFKWDNNFGWSYNGNITDSIKERVKAAGGNTNAKLRVSLAWFNHDDLDLHSICPEGHVYYGAKDGRSNYGMNTAGNGQILDVDMNAGCGTTRAPVENLSWRQPVNGDYRIQVNQYNRRETSNVGFTIELENAGSVTQYSYHKAVSGTIEVMTFKIKDGVVTDLKIGNKEIVGQGISQQKWNLPTEQFVKVNAVLLSPNFWDERSVGNKHWFFIVDGCQNDEPTRGIYNEFLKPELEKHRKVFEVLGNKTKCLPSTDQLSGLGFSSTKRDSVLVKVTDVKTTRLYQVNF